MATISVDTYLDGGTARTAGEVWTINSGAKLTIRTDTRVHANAPASMTGSLSLITINDGELFFDATAVRWMAFESGTGTVPAIGNTVSQGAVSGYFLGVWASLTSAPTAAGAAMPTTGFIKLREVTGGSFASGALSGIGASSSSSDVVGWIEIVKEYRSDIDIKRKGINRSRGDWFQIGVTSGSTGQTFQIPTNGGGANTYCPGVWIETNVASGQYEFYPSIVSSYYTTSNLSNDARSKFVRCDASGVITLGATTAGYIPPSGCRVRVPNIFIRQCNTTSRAVNMAPSTLGFRAKWITTSAGSVDLKALYGDWYASFSQAYAVSVEDCAFFDKIDIENTASSLTLKNGGVGNYLTTWSPGASLRYMTVGGNISDWSAEKIGTVSATGYAFESLNNDGLVFDNIKAGIITYSRNATGYAFYCANSVNCSFSNIKSLNQSLCFASSKNITVSGYDYCDRYVSTGGGSSGAPAGALITRDGCDNIVISDVSYGLVGAIASQYNYYGLWFSLSCSNIRLRNSGSLVSPVNMSSSGLTGFPLYSGGGNKRCKVQRVFLSNSDGIARTLQTDSEIEIQTVFGEATDHFSLLSKNSFVKGCKANSPGVALSGVYGSHFVDYFRSDTAGEVALVFNEISEFSASYYSVVSGSPYFDGQGFIKMPVLGDEVVFEMPYFALAHTGFANLAPTLTGVNADNFSLSYQIDNGSGFSGWKILSAANLTFEPITPSIGFKLKIKITTIVAGAANSLSFVTVATTTTTASMAENLYPLDQSTLTLIGLKPGSEVRFYKGLDPSSVTELGGIESSSTTYVLQHGESNADGYIIVHALNYIPIYLPWTYTATDVIIPIQQQIERNYKNE